MNFVKIDKFCEAWWILWKIHGLMIAITRRWERNFNFQSEKLLLFCRLSTDLFMIDKGLVDFQCKIEFLRIFLWLDNKLPLVSYIFAIPLGNELMFAWNQFGKFNELCGKLIKLFFDIFVKLFQNKLLTFPLTHYRTVSQCTRKCRWKC